MLDITTSMLMYLTLKLMVSPRQNVLPPNRLFRELESGRMSRQDFHAAMAVHAQELITEMEEQRRNPLAAFSEFIRNRRSARKLARRHGEAVVREVFVTLSEVDDFAPASLLWNAGHRHVPLYCFLRMRNRPLFRVITMESSLVRVDLTVEYQFGAARCPTREMFILKRDPAGDMRVESRKGVR